MGSNINKTISIIDALKEKEEIIKEELQLRESELEKESNRKRKFFFITSIISVIIGFNSLLDVIIIFGILSDPQMSGSGWDYIWLILGLCVIPTLIIVILVSVLRKRKPYDVLPYNALVETINKLKNDLFEAEKTRREIVLGYEKETLEVLDQSIMTNDDDSQADTKDCPMCAETIKAKAVVCRYCGYKFE